VDWKAQAFSFAGVLALVGFARLLRVGRNEPLTADEVIAAAALQLAPARIADTFLSTDGKAGIVRADDGALCLVKQHGSHPATRLLGPATHCRTDGDALVIDPGERMFGQVRLFLPTAERDRLRLLL
jgi:hypothetical protein